MLVENIWPRPNMEKPLKCVWERRLNGQRCSSKTMLDETIWSFSRGLIFMLTERRVYLTSHVCHSKGELNIIIFILILQFSKQALWSFSSALLMHWKSFQDHSWTFKNIGGVSWMNWGTLQMRCESFSSVVMHSKCIWNSLKCIWTRFSLSPVFPNRVTYVMYGSTPPPRDVTPDREVAFPTGLDRKWHSFPPIITIHRSITPTSKVEEL